MIRNGINTLLSIAGLNTCPPPSPPRGEGIIIIREGGREKRENVKGKGRKMRD
jgi:hypothetical protein